MTASIFNRGTSNKPNWGFSIYLGKDENGKPKRRFESGFARKSEAVTAADLAKAEIIAKRAADEAAKNAPPVSSVLPREPETLADFMPQWFENYAAVNCKPKTLERFRELAEYFMPKLGSIPLVELDPMTIEMEMNRLHAAGGRVKKTGEPRPLAPKTIQSIAGVLRSALTAARRWKKIPSNPMDDVQLPEVKRVKQEALDFEQTDRLLERAKTSWIGPLLTVAAATGCRRGELLALTWSDVDLDAGMLSITKSLEQTRAGLRVKSTKSDRPREFALPASAVQVFHDLRAIQAKSREAAGDLYRTDLDLVFGNELGAYRQPNSVSAMAARIAKSAGFPGVSLHNMRHGHGSQLISVGVPITEVSERLGHSSPAITLGIYSHALDSKKRNAADTWQAGRDSSRKRASTE